MKTTAVAIDGFGGPEVLRETEIELPALGPGEVLIAVEAAGVNRPDLLQRAGDYPPPAGASPIPGLEVAGTIVERGADAYDVALGERVCALVAGGGYARHAIAPAATCLPIPAGFSAVEAAAIPETYFTVWINVFDRAHLTPGESLLVHGGASGIGTTAVALAAALGSRVFATAGSAEKARACEALGAERGIDYRHEDFVAVVLAATSGRGVDVVADIVGGPYLERNLTVLAEDGRIAQIGLLGGPTAAIDLRLVMRKRITLTGSMLRPRSVAVKGEIARAVHANVWPLFERGAIRPRVDRTLAFSQASEAHRLLEAGAIVGKVVLVP